jgi:protein O-mannosyl-transferase
MLAWLLPVTALVMSPVLFADFIRLDDFSHLFDSPNFQRMSVSGLAAFWTKSYFNLYIPVTYSVWWVLIMVGRVFGTLRQNAWLFHAANFAVHLVNVTLVFLVVHKLLQISRNKLASRHGVGDGTIALIAALFFAIHPVQVESVAWVSELKGLLAAMFGLLGLWWHYRSSRRVLCAVFFIAAMLSKPSAIVFPGIVLLADRIVLGNSIRKSVVMPALYSAPLLILAYVTKRLQPDLELDLIPTAMQRLAVAADAFAFYVCHVLVPYPLAVDYGHSPQFVLNHTSRGWLALSGFSLVAGVAVVAKGLFHSGPAARDRGAYPLMTCGWAIFLLSVAPVLGLVPFGFQDVSTVADHYLYIALIGVSVMVAGTLVRFGAFANSRLVVAAPLYVFAALSFRQARLWQSTVTLFSHTVEVNPQSYLGYYCVADEYMHTKRFDEAIEWLTKSLTIKPDYLNAKIALGLAWAQKGEIVKAVEYYNETLAGNPSTLGTRARYVSSIHNNLGLLLLQVGFEAGAIDHFRKAVEIFPRSINGHLNLGNVAFSQRRLSDAIAEYQIAQSLNPGNPAIEQRLGRARQVEQGATPDDDVQRPLR